ncbi:MAG: pyridoxal phosphate-dependent aminotransferase [Lentisphaerae bacterium]|nr:pyridoxal phosphate-dependent aminotransferase [Lentisphaerota bacterium]
MNRRVAGIAPSETLAITAKSAELRAAGRKVWSFAAGEPDFDTPDAIKAAAWDALKKGQTKYAPVAGVPDLRKAIASKLKNDNGLDYRPDQVVVSNGGKHSLFNIFMTICDAGDEVIIPSPYWLSYPEMVRISGGTPVFVECAEENDYKMTPAQLEAAITPKTRAVIINSPSNPVGCVYSGEELRALADVIAARGIYVVSDEIYENIVYDGTKHVSNRQLSPKIFEKTITVNGFSKAASMTGWRLGYFAGPPEVVKGVTALQSHSTSGPNTFAQFGAIEALKQPPDFTANMVKVFDERRTYLHGKLSSVKGVKCVKPMGAFYIFPNISSFGMTSGDFIAGLLEKEGVAAVPGAPFGADGNIRFSYACSMEDIRAGAEAFERFVKSL